MILDGKPVRDQDLAALVTSNSCLEGCEEELGCDSGSKLLMRQKGKRCGLKHHSDAKYKLSDCLM